MDITKLAPKSVRAMATRYSGGGQKPDIRESHMPRAKGGEAGKMLRQIIEKAPQLKLKRRTTRKNP